MLPLLPVKLKMDVFNKLYSGRHIKQGGLAMRVMKIYCPECGQEANIQKIDRQGRDNAHYIYCSCSDFECGHTYRLTLTFSHSIYHKKPEDQPKQLCFDVIENRA